jgi:hypothetical protein
MPNQNISTVGDLHAEVRRLRSELQQLKPKPDVRGVDYVRERQDGDPRVRWESALNNDRDSQREAGKKRAAELLAENGDAYPRDGMGSKKLAEHAGLSIEDARDVFSSHLRKLDEQRGRHADAERTHLLGRAKQLAPQFVRTAVRNGIDVASRKLAERAQVSLSIAQQALEECADEMNGQHQQ